MDGYARLARLPPPRLQPVDVKAWIHRMVRLETRLEATVIPGPELIVQADGDQLDQLLINLLRNAVDAALLTGGTVQVGWGKKQSAIEVWVDDDGPGISNPSNLFVPLFTTKPKGSGIGLALSRQIAEAHQGSLVLGNRGDARGCRALLRLPIYWAPSNIATDWNYDCSWISHGKRALKWIFPCLPCFFPWRSLLAVLRHSNVTIKCDSP
jgi:two-component system nitrogen regulation sensor histidine kinase NtrY